jgi:hypothetical protein
VEQGLFWLLAPFCVLAAAMAFAMTYGERRVASRSKATVY